MFLLQEETTSFSSSLTTYVRKFPTTDYHTRTHQIQLQHSTPILTTPMLEQEMEHRVLAGRLFPFLSRLMITPSVLKVIRSNADIKELGILLFGGSGALSILARGLFQIRCSRRKNVFEGSWKASKAFHVTNHIQQGFRIGVAVYILDLLADVLVAAGFQNKSITSMSYVSATLLYTFWAMFRIRFYKTFLLQRMFKRISSSESTGVSTKSDWTRTCKFYNRIINYIIYIITVLLVIDMLGLNMGKSFQTLCAFGGVGTFVAGFASKDLAREIISGLSLSLGNSFQVGDRILCGDGTTGIIISMDLLNTIIRGQNELITKIPNSKIASDRVANLSLLTKSQVEQTLKLKYNSLSSTLEDIPNLLEAIKTKIREECPKLITEGRPFTVHWVKFEKNTIEVYIDCRFNIPGWSEEYSANRENMFLAINDAIKLNGFEYA